jgi:hypothetical protein
MSFVDCGKRSEKAWMPELEKATEKEVPARRPVFRFFSVTKNQKTLTT